MTPEALQTAIASRAWYPVVGILLWYLLVGWKRANADGRIVRRVPDGYRWIPPLLIAAATGFVDAYASGLSLEGALFRAAFAVIGIGLPAMGMQGAAKESPLGGVPGTFALVFAVTAAIFASTSCAAAQPIAERRCDDSALAGLRALYLRAAERAINAGECDAHEMVSECLSYREIEAQFTAAASAICTGVRP